LDAGGTVGDTAADKDWRHPAAVAGITGAFLFVGLPGRFGQFTPGFDLAGVLMGIIAVNVEDLGEQRGLDFIGENTGIESLGDTRDLRFASNAGLLVETFFAVGVLIDLVAMLGFDFG